MIEDDKLEKVLVVAKDELKRIVVMFPIDLPAFEFGLYLADIMRHLEKARGREFAASVFAVFYKELTKPTSNHTRLQ